jgi:hypothetical protein
MSQVNVAELMTDPDFAETFTVKRPTVTMVRGVGAATYAADRSAVGVVQPMEAHEVALLPEGERGSGEVIEVWTAEDLKAGDGKNTVGDVLVWKGKSYRVTRSEDFAQNGYRRFVATGFVS